MNLKKQLVDPYKLEDLTISSRSTRQKWSAKYPISMGINVPCNTITFPKTYPTHR